MIFLQKVKLIKTKKKERKKYKKPTNKGDPNSWIQEYLHNNNYSVLDNEGAGDCFFAVIRDGFKNINKDVSVDKLKRNVDRKYYTRSISKL